MVPQVARISLNNDHGDGVDRAHQHDLHRQLDQGDDEGVSPEEDSYRGDAGGAHGGEDERRASRGL